MTKTILLLPLLALVSFAAIGQTAKQPTGQAAAQVTAQPAAPGAGDPLAGRQKTSMCVGCHGIDGWRTAYPEVYRVPKLGGQNAAYIAKALLAYKSGERNHPSMKAVASSLTDQDIADLAIYYSSHAVTTAKK